MSLPVLGSIVDDFEAYLEGEGYTWKTRRVMFRIIRRVDQHFYSRGIPSVDYLRHSDIESCYKVLHSILSHQTS
jgi:hypothetical protein